jgi:hypothetical protein
MALRVIEPGRQSLPPPLTGEDVLCEIAEIIEDRLSSIAFDDPNRGALQALVCSAPFDWRERRALKSAE